MRHRGRKASGSLLHIQHSKLGPRRLGGLVVIDGEIVALLMNRLWHMLRHFLSHHAQLRWPASFVAELVDLLAVLQIPDVLDVGLETSVGEWEERCQRAEHAGRCGPT